MRSVRRKISPAKYRSPIPNALARAARDEPPPDTTDISAITSVAAASLKQASARLFARPQSITNGNNADNVASVTFRKGVADGNRVMS